MSDFMWYGLKETVLFTTSYRKQIHYWILELRIDNMSEQSYIKSIFIKGFKKFREFGMAFNN